MRFALFLVVATALSGVGLPTHARAGKSVGALTYVSGDVMVGRGKGKNMRAAEKGEVLEQGDFLKTGAKSRLEARLADGSVLRIGPESEMQLKKVRVKKKGKKTARYVRAKLFFGKVWAAVTKVFAKSTFEVTTTNAVAGVRGTRFATEATKDGKSTVKVYSGKVLVSNKPAYAIKGHTKKDRVEVSGPQEVSKKKWEEMITGAMQMVTVGSDGNLSEPTAFDFEAVAEGEDSWEAWNKQRDEEAGFKE